MSDSWVTSRSAAQRGVAQPAAQKPVAWTRERAEKRIETDKFQVNRIADELKRVAADAGKMARIEPSCPLLTCSQKDILSSFETRLLDLEGKMSPIHSVTMQLSSAYDSMFLRISPL
jgi:hypothetical protein